MSLSAWERRGAMEFGFEPIATLYVVPAEYATRYANGFEEEALVCAYCVAALAWRVYYLTWISMKEKMEEEGYGDNPYRWAMNLAHRGVDEFVDLTGIETGRAICQAAFNDFRKFYTLEW